MHKRSDGKTHNRTSIATCRKDRTSLRCFCGNVIHTGTGYSVRVVCATNVAILHWKYSQTNKQGYRDRLITMPGAGTEPGGAKVRNTQPICAIRSTEREAKTSSSGWRFLPHGAAKTLTETLVQRLTVNSKNDTKTSQHNCWHYIYTMASYISVALSRVISGSTHRPWIVYSMENRSGCTDNAVVALRRIYRRFTLFSTILHPRIADHLGLNTVLLGRTVMTPRTLTATRLK